MSTVSITGFENRIKDYALEHDAPISRRSVKRMALQVARRLERMTDLDRERLVMHSDVVPCEALHHILGRTTCRRCGREPGRSHATS